MLIVHVFGYTRQQILRNYPKQVVHFYKQLLSDTNEALLVSKLVTWQFK